MGKCIKCGTNFVGTPEQPPADALCKYCEIEVLKATIEHYRKSNETQGRIRGELYEALTNLMSRAEYVCAHRYGASDPVGTRIIAVEDLRQEIQRAREAMTPNAELRHGATTATHEH
jgi:hypothetical protein